MINLTIFVRVQRRTEWILKGLKNVHKLVQQKRWSLAAVDISLLEAFLTMQMGLTDRILWLCKVKFPWVSVLKSKVFNLFI